MLFWLEIQEAKLNLPNILEDQIKVKLLVWACAIVNAKAL